MCITVRQFVFSMRSGMAECVCMCVCVYDCLFANILRYDEKCTDDTSKSC